MPTSLLNKPWLAPCCAGALCCLCCSQALELYRRVRLQTLVATKAAVLASVPCTTSTTTEYSFSIDQNPDVSGGRG